MSSLCRRVLTTLILITSLAASLVAGAQSLRPWRWQESQCSNCGLKIQTDAPELQAKNVQIFIHALENYKVELTELYHSDPQEYNLLAHMAIGILGNESHFFKSKKYFVKKHAPWAISEVKKLLDLVDDDFVNSPNSSGPTQIKVVPGKIAEKYGVTPVTLRHSPEHAALATMGYLIEALGELKRRASNNHLEFITAATYEDYLPYIYFGKSRELNNRTATPDKNLYVINMKHYMTWVQLYEVDPVP